MTRVKDSWQRCCVYMIRNTVNQKAYIGSTNNLSKRWSEHRQSLLAGRHSCQHLQSSWNKYGAHSFEWIVIEDCSLPDLLNCEQYWLDYYRSCEPSRGYNIRPFAATSAGVVLSKETRRRMSVAHTGKKQSTEHARKQCEARRGRRCTPSQRVAMGAANRRIPVDVVDKLREMMARGMRQVEVARVCGVSQKFVSKVKLGQLAWVRERYANSHNQSS